MCVHPYQKPADMALHFLKKNLTCASKHPYYNLEIVMCIELLLG